MDPSPSNEGKSALSYALSGKIMLSAIVLLFTVVLLILFLHLYVRWHVRHRASRRARRRQRLVFASEDQSSAPCAVNRGLDPSILASLPVLPFCHCAKEDDESGECAVCLNEFKEGEKIRCLPRCSHSFHIDCIDMWFHSHSSCPLCRAAVDVEKEAAETNSRATTLTVENSATGADLNGNELCSSCQRVEEMGSSSSDSSCREVRIEIPASRADGTSGEEEQTSLRLELPEEQPLKTISRMVLIRWLLMRNPRLDMERGDGESPVPPQTPTTTTAADTTR